MFKRIFGILALATAFIGFGVSSVAVNAQAINQPLSALPVNPSPVPSDLLYVVHAGSSNKMTTAQLNAVLVDLANAQVITGAKTFSTAPVFSSLTSVPCLGTNSGGTLVNTGCVLLSPSSQQTGTINVSGTITTGNKIITTNGLYFSSGTIPLVIPQSSTNTAIYPAASGGTVFINNFANTLNNVSITDTGAVTIPNSGITIGQTATYSATQIGFGSGNGSGAAAFTYLGSCSACTVAGVIGNAALLQGGLGTNDLAVDVSGDLGIPGTYSSASSNPFAALGTAANTFTSKTTGVNTAFIFNASGSAPTGDLADFQLGGSTKAFIGNLGNASFGTATPLAFPNATSANTITSASTGVGFTFNATASPAINTTFSNNGTGIGGIATAGISGRGSSTFTVVSAIPPLYSQTGGSNTSTHSSFGTCTVITGTNPTCTVTFSGTGNTFTSAATYACNASAASAIVVTGLLPAPSTVNTSGTVETVGINGAVTTGGAIYVVCTGT